jgi:hypothetical protein
MGPHVQLLKFALSVLRLYYLYSMDKFSDAFRLSGINVTIFRLHVHSLLDLWFADWLHRPAAASETETTEATWMNHEATWPHVLARKSLGSWSEIRTFPEKKAQFWASFKFQRFQLVQGQLPSTLWGPFTGPSRLTDADPDGRCRQFSSGATKKSTMSATWTKQQWSWKGLRKMSFWLTSNAHVFTWFHMYSQHFNNWSVVPKDHYESVLFAPVALLHPSKSWAADGRSRVVDSETAGSAGLPGEHGALRRGHWSHWSDWSHFSFRLMVMLIDHDWPWLTRNPL